jgi:hypothetical protein
MSYRNNLGQDVSLDKLWRGIEEHCVSLDGAALILEKQLTCPDLQQVQKTICFVLDGLAQARNTLQADFQPEGFEAVYRDGQILTATAEDEV